MGSTDERGVLARQSTHDYVGVRGIWLRKIDGQVQVLAEGDDGWRLVIEEREDGIYSHIVEPAGILAAPLDPLSPEDQGHA